MDETSRAHDEEPAYGANGPDLDSGPPRGGRADSLWELAFRYRNYLVALPLVIAFLSLPAFDVNWVLWTVAMALCVAGAAIRAWARWHNTYARGRRKQLATTGPYAFVRNPLYIGSLLIFAGVGVVSRLEWLLPLAIGWAYLVYVAASKHEERRMLVKYGASFEAYRREVPAWWPRVWSVPSTPIKARGFGPVLAVQVLYASLWLVPFVFKEIAAFRLWQS
jgi:protein-S-isoprenylcysteine O-methyltransferase Ste14